MEYLPLIAFIIIIIAGLKELFSLPENWSEKNNSHSFMDKIKSN